MKIFNVQWLRPTLYPMMLFCMVAHCVTGQDTAASGPLSEGATESIDSILEEMEAEEGEAQGKATEEGMTKEDFAAIGFLAFVGWYLFGKNFSKKVQEVPVGQVEVSCELRPGEDLEDFFERAEREFGIPSEKKRKPFE